MWLSDFIIHIGLCKLHCFQLSCLWYRNIRSYILPQFSLLYYRFEGKILAILIHIIRNTICNYKKNRTLKTWALSKIVGQRVLNFQTVPCKLDSSWWWPFNCFRHKGINWYKNTSESSRQPVHSRADYEPERIFYRC